MRILITLFVITFLGNSSVLAWQLKGTIKDQDGEPMPYARVYVENSTYGVVSNLKGEYFLELENGTYNLVFSSLGYEKKTLPVTISNANQVLNVILEPEGVEMEAMTVTADRRDPAYEIIEKVVDNKHRYLEQFNSFKCDTYLKVILEADSVAKKKSKRDSTESSSSDSTQVQADAKKTNAKTAPPPGMMGDGKEGATKIPGREKLNFLEQVSETWYQFPHQFKEIVKAMNDYTEKVDNGGVSVTVESGGDSEGPPTGMPASYNPYLFIPTVSQSDFNFYRNAIEFPSLGQQPFISPISSSGKVYYKYRLEESFMENGMVIHKIEVIPRKWEGPMFEGYIYIVADLWCIKSVDLTIQPGAMNYYNKFQLIHEYQRIDTNWVLSREEYFYSLKEGKRNFYGSTLALHSEYTLNPEIPKRFFANELRRVEDEAYERDSSYWVDVRPVILKPEEENFIFMQDSLHEVWTNADSLAKRDSAYNRITIWDVLLQGVGFHNQAKKRSIYINSLLESMQFFSPGGYRHSLGGSYTKEFQKGYVLRVTGNLNYGFLNQDLRGEGQVSFRYLPKHFGRGYIGYGNIFSQINSYESFTSFFSRANYVNKIHYSLGHEYELVNGLYADVELRRVEYISLANFNIEAWSDSIFGGGSNIPPDFQPYEESQINLKLTFTPFQKYHTEPYRKVILGSKFPQFTLRYNKSIPGLMGSDCNYDKFELQMTDEFQIGNLGKSSLNVYVGSFLNTDSVNYVDYKFFRGSDPVWFNDPLFSFQLIGPSFNTTQPYLGAHYFHNFQGFFFNKIPGIRRLKLMTVAGANVLATIDNNLFHAEVYAGIQLPFRIKKQLMALGTYYVTSLSTANNFNNQLKVGLIFFNSFTGKWDY
jgi:Family of unknown function (DUF5686)/CarboxypepD_reg-like domain